MEYNIENHLIFLNGGSNKIWCLFELELGHGGYEFLKVMSCELADLRMSSTTKLLMVAATTSVFPPR